MPGVDLEKRLAELLQVKDKHGLDNDQLLLLMGLSNLMAIINLLEMRVAGGAKGSGTRRPPSPQEAVPFLGIFGGPRVRQPADGAAR